MWVVGAGLVVVAYLIGSVCFGLVVAQRQGIDLREIGSGNVGATNVGRALGKSAARLVLALDAAKGLLPALAANLIFGMRSPWPAAVGLAATLGHVLPIWHGFKGGKGAATALGVMLGTVPVAGVIALLTFVGLRAWTKRASVGSLGGAALGAIATALYYPFAWIWPHALAGGLVLLVAVRHIDNIGRLLSGTEPTG